MYKREAGRQQKEIDVVEETKKKCLFQNFKLMSSRRASFLFVFKQRQKGVWKWVKRNGLGDGTVGVC